MENKRNFWRIFGIVAIITIAATGLMTGCDLLDEDPPTGVTVTPATVTVPQNGERQFSATVAPTGASQKVTWTIDPVNAGTIVNGLLKPTAAPGTTITVKATSTDPEIFGTATVTVGEPVTTPTNMTITITGIPSEYSSSESNIDLFCLETENHIDTFTSNVTGSTLTFVLSGIDPKSYEVNLWIGSVKFTLASTNITLGINNILFTAFTLVGSGGSDPCDEHNVLASITITGLGGFNGEYAWVNLGTSGDIPKFQGGWKYIHDNSAPVIDLRCWECNNNGFKPGNYWVELIIEDIDDVVLFKSIIESINITAGDNTIAFSQFPNSEPQVKSLTITGFGSNHLNYYYQIDLFENEDDIKPWFNNTGPESLSKLCLQGQISGGLISELLLKGEYNPFTGTGPYYIFLQVFDMDLEESNYRFDQSYYLSAAIDFSGQQDIELEIGHFDGFNPWNGNGNGNGGEPGYFQISGTIINYTFEYTEALIIIYYGAYDVIDSTYIHDFSGNTLWSVWNFYPIPTVPGTSIWGEIKFFDEDDNLIDGGSFFIKQCNGVFHFDAVIDFNDMAQG